MNQQHGLVAADDLMALVANNQQEAGSFSSSYPHPLTGKDVLDILDFMNVKSNEICAALEVNSNQWGYMTRVCKDGRDMSEEFVDPYFEMFMRLAHHFPQLAPWNRISIAELCRKGGWTLQELAFVCGVPQTSFERYAKIARASPPAQTAQLMNFISRLLDAGISPELIKSIAEKVYEYRNDLPLTRMTSPTSWLSYEEQDYRRVRKTIRQSLKTLLIDGEDSIREGELSKIISALYTKKMQIQDVMKRSAKEEGLEKNAMRFILEKSIQWMHCRYERQHYSTLLMRMSEDDDSYQEVVKKLDEAKLRYGLVSQDLERLAEIDISNAE